MVLEEGSKRKLDKSRDQNDMKLPPILMKKPEPISVNNQAAQINRIKELTKAYNVESLMDKYKKSPPRKLL